MLEAKDLWISAPGSPEHMVVRGFSLRVGRGEWVALVGSNGSGKTSVALALAGLRSLRRGSIELEGRPLRPGQPEGRRRVAAVLEQTSTQILQDTVADEVAYTSRNLGLRDEHASAPATRWIRRLGLEADAGRDPRHLSAGGQQRVLLAAALASEPALLVADEAGAHLDREARSIVLEALRERVRSGLTVVWVTQEWAEMDAADRVVTLGSPSRGRPARAARSPSPDSSPFLRVRVAPWDGGPGPHVGTASGFDIEVPRRGVVALLGPNGIGKSAILSTVAGLDPVGQIGLEWQAPSGAPVAYSGQFPELQTFEERVGDEIVFGAVSRGMAPEEARRRAIRELDLLGLEGESFVTRITWDLSAGERRIVQVVGALIADASIVVLDEPAAGLDETKQAGLADLIARRSEGAAILLASHDHEWARVIGATIVDLMDLSVMATTLPSPSKKTD